MASAVLAFGIATSIIAMQSGFRFLDVARGTTLASQIMQSEIERIRMMSWATVSSLPAIDEFDGSTYFSTNPRVASKFTVTRVREQDATRPADVTNITISVTWNSYDGRQHVRRFQAKYMKNGLYDYYYTLASPAS